MTNDQNPRVYGLTDLTYDDYLKVKELTSLQNPQSDPPHHDEMLFIIIHQSYELWFKLMMHELNQAKLQMRKSAVLEAYHFLKRIVAIQKLLVSQIHILETMKPVDFLAFRDRLNPASGFQSIQFRVFEFALGLQDEEYLVHFKNKPHYTDLLEAEMKVPGLKQVYYELLGKLGMKIPQEAHLKEKDPTSKEALLKVLKEIYQSPNENMPIYLLTESLLEIDQYLSHWRDHHVRVVERIIGFKRGTGGSSGVGYLRATTEKKCFPLLWEVRTFLEKV